MNNQLSGYQLFAAKTIHFMLSDPHFRENYRKVGYRNIFGDLIRQYPEINIKGEKTWTKIPLYKTYHRFTERAANLLEEGNYKSWKDFKYEHITPVKVILEDLVALGENPSLDAVVNVLSQSEVIILTKEEAEALDGSAYQQYPLDGEMVFGAGMRSSGRTEERLTAISATLASKFSGNSLF
jgi:hypothetical protein